MKKKHKCVESLAYFIIYENTCRKISYINIYVQNYFNHYDKEEHNVQKKQLILILYRKMHKCVENVTYVNFYTKNA